MEYCENSERKENENFFNTMLEVNDCTGLRCGNEENKWKEKWKQQKQMPSDDQREEQDPTDDEIKH